MLGSIGSVWRAVFRDSASCQVSNIVLILATKALRRFTELGISFFIQLCYTPMGWSDD